MHIVQHTVLRLGHVIRLGVRSGLKGGWGETGNERHADEVMTCLALH